MLFARLNMQVVCLPLAIPSLEFPTCHLLELRVEDFSLEDKLSCDLPLSVWDP